jgi:hypothetical protein
LGIANSNWGTTKNKKTKGARAQPESQDDPSMGISRGSNSLFLLLHVAQDDDDDDDVDVIRPEARISSSVVASQSSPS